MVNTLHAAPPSVVRVVFEVAARAMIAGVRLAEHGVLDFGDMLYVPALYQTPPVERWDWVIVDEAQDLSPAALDLLATLVPPALAVAPEQSRARLLAVGDAFQSIYGFAGADTQSFDRVAARYEATRLPLSITYRCPRAHVRLCQQIVPDMQARPGAPEGVVRFIGELGLLSEVQGGDLVVCRATAPLVSTCIRLVATGVKATVRGRDIGARVSGFFQEAHRANPKLGLVDAVLMYAARQARRIREDLEPGDVPDDAMFDRLEALEDMRDCAVTILRWCGPGVIAEDFAEQVKAIFSDGKSSVVLSTVHRAKGLEADRVFVLAPHLLPHDRRASSEEAAAQERNVAFVAASRARAELVIVEGDQRAHPFWRGQLNRKKAVRALPGAVMLRRDGVEVRLAS